MSYLPLLALLTTVMEGRVYRWWKITGTTKRPGYVALQRNNVLNEAVVARDGEEAISCLFGQWQSDGAAPGLGCGRPQLHQKAYRF
jgi:hypothetical protein